MSPSGWTVSNWIGPYGPYRLDRRFALTVVIGLALFVSIYGPNWRMYRGAQLLTETGATVEEVSENMNYFSPLSTFARERLLNIMTDRMGGMDAMERLQLIPQLERESQMAIDAESNNMELRFAVARFYRAAATVIPPLAELAGKHTTRGVELGPHTLSAKRALAEQEEFEASIESFR